MPTASPSASVLPESPSSVTGVGAPVKNAASMQGACVGSTNQQFAASPKTAFTPKVMPPGAPPTPQGRYRFRGCASSTLTPASSSCFLSRSAATA